jgi:hypothetical protein
MSADRWRIVVSAVFVGCCLAPRVTAAAPSLTIYNQNFAVVRDTVALDLKPGVNPVHFAGATAYVEPASVVLRDPAGKKKFEVLEQNYRGDPVSQAMLLALNEGKTIEFERSAGDGGQTNRELIAGRIIRAGGRLEPLVELDGKLRFGLPGLPIFPALPDDIILKPTLSWIIQSDEAAKFDAELSYVTGEMRWEANYNLVLPEEGDSLDFVGWITMGNDSGRSFEQARIKLMAGDVNKIQYYSGGRSSAGGGGGGGGRPVHEMPFDDYHLYTLERPTTLLDHEQKQVEFVRAAGVHSAARYVYDGASVDPEEQWSQFFEQPDFGTLATAHVWAFRDFTNSAGNQLGLPLPKGLVRVYRRNTDGAIEFTGENTIPHTPRDEVVQLFTGNAFDLVGERKRTDFKDTYPDGTIDPTTGLPIRKAGPRTIDESFEITLRNHKEQKVEIRVIEHLYRWSNWEIQKNSDSFRKIDAQTIEFLAKLKPNEERHISYTAHYWW